MTNRPFLAILVGKRYRGIFTLEKQSQDVDMAAESEAALSAVGITPEMIEAGIVALREWAPVEEGRFSGWDRFAVRDVFLAMNGLSKTDKGSIPKPHQWIIDHSGVTRWSPLFDSIQIEPLPQNGKRIRITIKSDNMVDFDLTEEQITHLIALLVYPTPVAKLDEKA